MSPPPTKVINGQSFSSPSIPDVSLPAPPDPSLDPAAYLRSIYAVRERSQLVYRKARANQLRHFDVDLSKWPDTVEYVGRIIKVLYTLFELQTNAALEPAHDSYPLRLIEPC